MIKNGKVYVFDFGHWIAWQGLVPESQIWVNPTHAIDFSRWGWDWFNGPSRNHDQWRTSKLDTVWNKTHETAKSVNTEEGQKYFINLYNWLVSSELKKLNVGVPAEKVALSCSKAVSL